MPSRATQAMQTSQLGRRPTTVTLPESLLQEAQRLGVDVSQACEGGLATAVSSAKAQRWLVDNRAAMDAWNRHVEENGLPLGEFHQF